MTLKADFAAGYKPMRTSRIACGLASRSLTKRNRHGLEESLQREDSSNAIRPGRGHERHAGIAGG